MSLNTLYLRLLALAVVVAPFIWLVFTEDGQRRTDQVLLALIGNAETMDIAFAKLQGAAAEQDFRHSFPDLGLECADRTTHFGDRVCNARIASFNGTPARYVAVYFLRGGLSAVQTVYQPAHHEHALAQLHAELGAPEHTDDDSVYLWRTPHGLVLAPTTRPTNEEATVVWLSSAYLGARAGISSL
jgi:hypothetical protein